MKKMLVIPMITLVLVMLATSVFAATSTLADKIYSKGSAYGVTADHKKQMDQYFTNNPTTAEEDEFILAKADECIAIMDKAGVKDVRKLSDADLKAIEGKVQEAANKIGLTVSNFKVTDTEVSFNVSKNGKTVAAAVISPKGSTSTTGKKFVYTGSNATLAVASIAVALVAGVAVAKLRKNA